LTSTRSEAARDGDSATRQTRLVFADWLRIAAFGLLVLYHVGMFYVTWDWHVKSPQASTALEPWMRLVSPWRMDLLFAVSGIATAFMLKRGGASGSLLRQRARRLLLPLLFGVLVVVPPQSYLEVVQRHGYAGSYLDFLRLYFTGYGGFCGGAGAAGPASTAGATTACLVLPTWNHLWFLPYLFSYTLAAWAVLRRWPDLLDALATRASAALSGRHALLVLAVVPLLWLAATRWALKPHFPVTHALVDDLYAHVQYFGFFVLGLVLGRAPEITAPMERLRWLALGAALAAWALLEMGLAPGPGAAASGPWRGWACALAPGLVSLVQWGGIVAAFGFACRHFRREGPLRRYLTDAVFPVYVLHQSILIVAARALSPLALPPVAEGLVLVAVTFAGSLAGYEVVRRIRWARPLFGLKPLETTAAKRSA
jgi:hypothetical protein